MYETKLKAGRLMVPVKIDKKGNRLEFHFGFNRPLMEEVKSMKGAKYHGYDEINPRKIWSVIDCARNQFQIKYLEHPGANDSENPYAWYDRPLVEYKSQPRKCPRCKTAINSSCGICLGKGEVSPYTHQIDMVRSTLTYRKVILAAEMGTGKTLTAILVLEYVMPMDAIWVGPRSALYSVNLEFDSWNALIRPRFYTYEGFKKLVEEWPEDKKTSSFLVLDESSRLKNPTAQRSVAVEAYTERMIKDWGKDCYIIEMSGSPSPKDPSDWHNQCEIASPGFLREGTKDKCRKRLAVIENRNSLTGGQYPHLVTWKDNPLKCDQCGQLREAEQHNPANFDREGYHSFKESVNEVSLLYQRMKGLVTVKLKKECLDLPDKVYRIIECKPSQSVLNAASAISAKASSTITALTLLRELSDGFQYQKEEFGEETCRKCNGLKVMEEMYDANDPEHTPSPFEFERGRRIIDLGNGELEEGPPLSIAGRFSACDLCSGTGTTASIRRSAVQTTCPKEDVLRDLLDENEEQGRIVIYAGFTGSIDRVTDICQKAKWEIIRADGRGWHSTLPGKGIELLRSFQYAQEQYSKVAFIGQPSSAGMGLNLTASSMIVYYSNDFNGESRIQSEDRCHRPGMDLNKGCTIVDIIHLPSDRLVLENLKKKKRLQDMTLGVIRNELEGVMPGIRML